GDLAYRHGFDALLVRDRDRGPRDPLVRQGRARPAGLGAGAFPDQCARGGLLAARRMAGRIGLRHDAPPLPVVEAGVLRTSYARSTVYVERTLYSVVERGAVMTGAVVQVDGVHKRYGQTHALRGIDLSVAAGTVCGLLGPNGAGKTTVVR